MELEHTFKLNRQGLCSARSVKPGGMVYRQVKPKGSLHPGLAAFEPEHLLEQRSSNVVQADSPQNF